ncbi:hypothetical protein OIU74_030128 [Salix koriyanagi]|uniref:DUF4220 domain-containing protein n=1 Tax=Salix koriyanagi TaxID=2511006 RepID=A0A9Q0ZV38_9ROSI|nr:hypothetical protein OIU74_030128 [Salix koriyanagi]
MNELSRKFEEFSNPDVFEMTDEPVVGELGLSDIIDEAKFLHEADLCFQMFRVLFADLVLGDSIHLATHIFLREKTAMEAFKLIEVEMGFMYDVLYTKLAKIRSSRVIFHATTFLCLVSALLAFSLEEAMFDSVYRTICSSRFLNNDKKWENRMAQHNLIRFQLSKGKTTCISLKKLLGKSSIQSLEVVGDDLKKFIFQYLSDKRGRYKSMKRSPDPGSNDLHGILSERGHQVIGRETWAGV